jgi:hypothetical protein
MDDWTKVMLRIVESKAVGRDRMEWLDEFEEEFRRRCRRMDAKRRKAGCALRGHEKKWQYHTRSAIYQLMRGLQLQSRIDLTEVGPEDAARLADAAGQAAAMLLRTREVIDAGGCTRAYYDIMTRAAGN